MARGAAGVQPLASCRDRQCRDGSAVRHLRRLRLARHAERRAHWRGPRVVPMPPPRLPCSPRHPPQTNEGVVSAPSTRHSGGGATRRMRTCAPRRFSRLQAAVLRRSCRGATSLGFWLFPVRRLGHGRAPATMGVSATTAAQGWSVWLPPSAEANVVMGFRHSREMLLSGVSPRTDEVSPARRHGNDTPAVRPPKLHEPPCVPLAVLPGPPKVPSLRVFGSTPRRERFHSRLERTSQHRCAAMRSRFSSRRRA